MQPWALHLPFDLPTTIGEPLHRRIVQQPRAPAQVFAQPDAHRRASLGEDQPHQQLPGPVADFRVPLFLRTLKGIFQISTDIELVLVAALFVFAQGDEDVSLLPRSVLIHDDTGRALVVQQALAVTPALVLIGYDVVLQVAYLLALLEAGALSLAIK